MAADRKACDECKLKCSLIHGNKTDRSPLVTTFIKILFARYDLSQQLCLPPKISQAIPGLVAGENYILQDSSGQRWEVKLGTKDDVLAFREGWTKFYEDHGLRVGYVLTFHYIRNSYFVVQICDTTGFEKLKFPVATGKKRKKSEIEGNCNTVGECPNISDHSTKKQGAAFSDAYQHVAAANCDTEQIYMINRDDGCNYEDRSPLLNLANSEFQFRIDPDGGSDNRPPPSITSVESDAVAGNLNENTVSAKIVRSEPPPKVISPTLSNNITSNRANVAEVDNDHHGGHPYVSSTANQAQVPSECRIKSPTMSSKRVNERATGRKKHSEKHPKSSNRSAQTSGGVERNNEVRVRRVVRTKPVDADSVDASAFSFTAIVESHEILELPPSVKFWESVEKKVVNLQGPNEEVWPVLYQNGHGIKALTSGWEHFYSSCRLQKGDKCGFILEDEATSTFRVDVT